MSTRSVCSEEHSVEELKLGPPDGIVVISCDMPTKPEGRSVFWSGGLCLLFYRVSRLSLFRRGNTRREGSGQPAGTVPYLSTTTFI